MGQKDIQRFSKDKQAIAYSGCSDVVIVYDTTAVKSAIAKCYPQDTFDYDTGVAIAYARLKGIEIPKVEEEPEFKRVGNGQEYYCIGKFNTARFGAVYTLETDHFWIKHLLKTTTISTQENVPKKLLIKSTFY